MKMLFKAFGKKIFGAHYEGLTRALSVCLVVFLGLRLSGLRAAVSPLVLYLMTGAFTAGIMWQGLSSGEQADEMQNLFMLPLEKKWLNVSYVTVLGAGTILTRTAVLLAVLYAVSDRTWAEGIGVILWAVHTAFLTACIYGRKDCWYVWGLWAVSVPAAVFVLQDSVWSFAVMAGSSALALGLIQRMDEYTFYVSKRGDGQVRKSCRHMPVWHYLFRYLAAHKNYLFNTAVLWCIGGVLPLFFRGMERRFALPIGFAVLTVNTPMCILLSCDPALLQAVRFLPDGKRRFGVPYVLFLFLCNLTADSIFLVSFQMQTGGVTGAFAGTAVCFALQSAAGSVLLEWFFPIRGWKMESDLWHHPRKYIVPAAMLLLAGAVSASPAVLPGLVRLLAAEAVFWIC